MAARSSNASARSPAGDPWAGLAPATLLAAVFFFAPIANMALLSVRGADGGLSAEHYAAFFATPHLVDALLRSLVLAGSVTLITGLLAWPLAYFIAFVVAPRWRLFCLLLLIAPFWTSFTIRAFSWQLVLSDNGVIAWAIEALTGEAASLGVLYTMGASIFGLALFGVMLTTLTLYSAMSAIDPRLIEASAALGGSPWAVFRDVIAPLAAPGCAAGLVLTFIIAVGDYAVPSLLGGGLQPVLAQLLLSTVKGTYDLASAATMAVILAGVVVLATIPLAFVGFAESARR